jgi:hypothetical protein
MADIKFEDFTIEVLNVMDDGINAVLEECAGEMESQVKRNTRVASSQTKNNWRHHVDTAKHVATIGNNLENAIWEELGTGEYALEGNGRQGGWSYVDEEGNGHFTHGKKPSRAFHNAYTALKNPIISRIQEAMKGLN